MHDPSHETLAARRRARRTFAIIDPKIVLEIAELAIGLAMVAQRRAAGLDRRVQHHFLVYDREGQKCACGGVVKRFTQNGRSTFWCPKCQK